MKNINGKEILVKLLLLLIDFVAGGVNLFKLLVLFIRGNEKYKVSTCSLCDGKGVLNGSSSYVEVYFNGQECYCCNGTGIVSGKEATIGVLREIEHAENILRCRRAELRQTIKAYTQKYVASPLTYGLRIEEINKENMIRFSQMENLLYGYSCFLEVAKNNVHKAKFIGQQMEIVKAEQRTIGDRLHSCYAEEAIVMDIDIELKWLKQDVKEACALPSLKEEGYDAVLINDLTREVNAITKRANEFLKVA